MKCGKGAWAVSCLFGGEVVDGVPALRVEAGDARDRVDATREAAPGTEHDHVDAFGDLPPRDGDDAFLPTLFDPIGRSARMVSLGGDVYGWVASVPFTAHCGRPHPDNPRTHATPPA